MSYDTNLWNSVLSELQQDPNRRNEMNNRNEINERVGRGRFAAPNAFQVAYGKHQYDDELSFPIVEQSVKPFAPFATCNSLFMFVLIQ